MRGIKESLESRFAQMFIPEPNSGCWLWEGAVRGNGYGQISMEKSRPISAHRAAWMIFKGEIPEGRIICHKCDNRACVNPDHLYVGTHKTNKADATIRNRWKHPWAERTSCSRGHEYEVYGFRIAKDGSRTCRECSRLAMQRYRERQSK